MDKILYFPYISIPKTPWLTRALLYWDRIGSIVPYEYVHRPETLDPYMRELVTAGLVEQIFPEQHIYRIPRFEEGFLAFIDHNERTPKPSRRHREHMGVPARRHDAPQPALQIHDDKLAGRRQRYTPSALARWSRQQERRPPSFPIHRGKLEGLAARLVERGLARRVDRSWIEVEGYTAYHFMSYLASLLGAITDYQPATDGYAGLAYLAGHSSPPKHIFQLRDQLRAQVLNDVLPSPANIEDIGSLVRFKETYGEQLVRFRRHVEDFLDRLESAPGPKSREMIARFRAANRDEMAELSARMREQKWQFINTTTICSVASSIIPFTKAVEQNQKHALWEAVPGLIAAISTALSARQVRSLQRHPLAYALIARQTFPHVKDRH